MVELHTLMFTKLIGGYLLLFIPIVVHFAFILKYMVQSNYALFSSYNQSLNANKCVFVNDTSTRVMYFKLKSRFPFCICFGVHL